MADAAAADLAPCWHTTLTHLEEQQRLLALEVQVLQLQVARNQATLERLVVLCEKMSGHIDFVDTVYERVRHPLTYVASLVGSTSELPARNTRLLRDSGA